MKPRQLNFFYVLAVFLLLLTLRDFWAAKSQVTSLPYNEFQALLKENALEDLTITGNEIRGYFRKPEANGKKKPFVVQRVDADLAKTLDLYGIRYQQVVESTFLRDLISWTLPLVIFFGIWLFFIRKMAEKGGFGGGLMTIGKSKAKIYLEKQMKVSFDDVAGVDEAKAELAELVQFLKDPKTYGGLGARMPKGVLLVGPPGTGKTLLARAVAGEAQVPFFSISGSEFVELFVGVGAARVRDLFEQARQQAPCIIFIDELDALGRARMASPMGGGHDEKEQTLNQLLVELDGFDSSVGIVLLGATNRPELLDPALLRAGRFDRQVLVDRPDKRGRTAILKVHTKKISLDPATNLDEIAALTAGFTGADLANLTNEAALVATRRQGKSVQLADFTKAIERIVAGLEKRNRLLNPQERQIVAYHEMGHALVSVAVQTSDEVHKVSIIPRGVSALGYTIQRPTEDRYLMTSQELENKMAVLMGGRAAEWLIIQQFSTGAADDIARATDIARSIVTRYGMIAKLGNVAYESETRSFLTPDPFSASQLQRNYSEETSREIDCAIRELLASAYEKALQVLHQNQDLLKESAEQLLAKETLEQEDLKRIFARVVKPQAGSATPPAIKNLGLSPPAVPLS